MVFFPITDRHSKWMFDFLDPYDFKIYFYMVTSVIRTKRVSYRFRNGEECYLMYKHGGVLPVNISFRQTAKKLGICSERVQKSIKYLCEIGAAIKINIPMSNNIYIIGFENRFNPAFYTEVNYYLAESLYLQAGSPIPKDLQRWIVSNCKNAQILVKTAIKPYGHTLSELLFQPDGKAASENNKLVQMVR